LAKTLLEQGQKAQKARGKCKQDENARQSETDMCC